MDARDLLDLAWIIPALPAFGAVVLLLFGKRIGEPKAGWLATGLMALAFVASVVAFFALALAARGRPHRRGQQRVHLDPRPAASASTSGSSSIRCRRR